MTFVRPMLLLSDAQVAEADAIAEWQEAEAARNKRKNTNNADYIDPKTRLRGLRAEVAVREWLAPLGAPAWLTGLRSSDFINKPDFATEPPIDVKSIKKSDHHLIVPTMKRQHDWIYLLVDASEAWRARAHWFFYVAGWAWGRELVTIEEYQPGRPHYVAGPLHDPADLRNMLYKSARIFGCT